MSNVMRILEDLIFYIKDFIESFSDDYAEACRVMTDTINRIRKIESDEYIGKQREMRNESIEKIQEEKAIRLNVFGGKLVKGRAKASYDEETVHLRNAQEFKKNARRKRRIRNINSYAERNHAQHDYVHTDPVGTGYGSGRTGLFEEKKKEDNDISLRLTTKTRVPMDAITAEEKFRFLYDAVMRMYNARKPKEEFLGGKDGVVVVQKNQNYDRDYIEFRYKTITGDLPYLAMSVVHSFFKFMVRTTGDAKKWAVGAGIAYSQMDRYSKYQTMMNRSSTIYAFCSSAFDDFMQNYDGGNEIVKFAYREYAKNYKGVTRSDTRERERDASTFGGKKLRKKRLDDYSRFVEDSRFSFLYGETGNHLYEIALSGAFEALVHCDCVKHPEKFKDDKSLYLSREEILFCMRFIRSTIKLETKDLKHEVIRDEALSALNVNSEDFDAETEYYRQMSIEASKMILGDLDPESEDEAVKDEIELIKLKTRHPYDSHCLVAHYPSLDSRIITGTDCLIAYDQLIHAKNPRTKMDIFTEREKLLLVLRRKGFSFEEIGKMFPKNGDEPEDQATVADEFTRIWVKPPAQAWLRDLGKKGCIEAEVQLERYQNRTAKPDPVTGKRPICHEARDRKQAIIDADLKHDEEMKNTHKANKLRAKELEERKALRKAHATLN